MEITCPRCNAAADEGARFCQTCGAAMGEGGGDLVGQVVARKYRVIDSIGEGSMGRIYLAEHLGLEKRVALKVLHREVELGPEGLQRFRREGVAAGKFSHPNAIDIYDFDVTEAGDAFLAMEYVEGKDLRSLLEKDGALDLETARDVVLQILDALAAAHRHGIVHRDLKPENIMVTESLKGLRVKVLDFGLSKLVHQRIEASLATVPGRIIGTPFYMAPEQSSGEEADARTDLYAVGVIFYELLAGQRPFTGRNLTELLYAQATQDAPALSDLVEAQGLPEYVDGLISRALERDREDRYQSADEMAMDLIDESVSEPSMAGEAGGSVARPTDRVGSGSGSRTGSRGAPRARRRGSDSDVRGGRRGTGAETAGRPAWLLPAGVAAGLLAVGAAAMVLTSDGGSGETQAGTAAAEPAVDAARIRLRPESTRTPAEQSYLTMLDRAGALVAAGDSAGASALVDTLMILPERDPEAYLIRARVYLARGDDDAAAADLRAALAEDPGFAEALVESGWMELRRGDAEVAEQRFDSALGLNERSAGALAGRAALLSAGGDDAAARGAYTAALDQDSNSWRAHLGLGQLELREGNTARSVECFIEAKRVNARSIEVLRGLGRAYLADGRAGDATKQFTAALELAPGDEGLVASLSAALLDGERYGDAVSLLRPIVLGGGVDGELQARLGLALASSREPERAAEALRAALDDGHKDARACALLASLELEAGNAAAALAAAESAIAIDVVQVDGHLFRGLALFQLERFEEAEIALRRATALDREIPVAWLVLGALGMDYLAEGDRAQVDLETYLEVGGEDPRAEAWLEEITAR